MEDLWLILIFIRKEASTHSIGLVNGDKIVLQYSRPSSPKAKVSLRGAKGWKDLCKIFQSVCGTLQSSGEPTAWCWRRMIEQLFAVCISSSFLDLSLTERRLDKENTIFFVSLISVQYRSNVSWQSWLETQFSILKVFENRVSRLEFQVSIFEVREPSFEDRVLSFETLEEFFKDLEQRFRGNDLILKNKTIAMNKAIDTRLYSRKLTHCWMYANIFSCFAFSTRHMRFAYLPWSWWQQTTVPLRTKRT